MTAILVPKNTVARTKELTSSPISASKISLIKRVRTCVCQAMTNSAICLTFLMTKRRLKVRAQPAEPFLKTTLMENGSTSRKNKQI